MSRPYTGLGGCNYCGLRVLWALDREGNLVAVDENRPGPVVIRRDCTGTPRIRYVPASYQAAEGEKRARLHNSACIGLAEVVPISRAPSLRCRPSHAARERRAANAR